MGNYHRFRILQSHGPLRRMVISELSTFRTNCLDFPLKMHRLSYNPQKLDEKSKAVSSQVFALTRLTYNCAHLRSTKEGLIFEYLDPRVTKKSDLTNFFAISEHFLRRIFLVEHFFGVKIFGVKFFGCQFFLVENFFGVKFFG